MIQLLTIVKIAHLIGLIMGLGGATLLDLTIFRYGVLSPISAYTIHQMKMLSNIVTAGLATLWATGIGLIVIGMASKPEYITNPKLWAKVMIVALLTANGALIHARVMPYVERSINKNLFEHISNRHAALLTGVGAISFCSWFAPFILGKASELNYTTPMLPIFGAYVCAVLIVWIGMFTVMSCIGAIQSGMRSQ